MGQHNAHSSDKSTMQTNTGKSKRDKGTPGYEGKHREKGKDEKK